MWHMHWLGVRQLHGLQSLASVLISSNNDKLEKSVVRHQEQEVVIGNCDMDIEVEPCVMLAIGATHHIAIYIYIAVC